MSFEEIVSKQKAYFQSGKTRDIKMRLDQIRRLETAVKKHEDALLQALRRDLGKCREEAFMTEIGYFYRSAGLVRKHLRGWMKKRRKPVPFFQPGARAWIQPEPYGSVLVIGPYNYPFQLVAEPLLAALAAGNTVVVKPSEFSTATEAVLVSMITEAFSPEYVAVVTGGRDETEALLREPFDYIFFTGSIPVGKAVMRAASEHLTPVTLELGGKSPAIVDRTAKIDVAASRIVWGKMINAGQTCVAPDYVLVHREVADALVAAMKDCLRRFFGEDPEHSPDFGRMINQRHFTRVSSMIPADRTVAGGQCNPETKYIAPTLVYPATWDDALMGEEIFGPVLPVLVWDDTETCVKQLQQRPKPLALYLFTEDQSQEHGILDRVSFGGGCINDTLSHLTAESLPFGGVGQSGMGSYHGEAGFQTFSHLRPVMKKPSWFNLSIAFPPYAGKEKYYRKLLR